MPARVSAFVAPLLWLAVSLGLGSTAIPASAQRSVNVKDFGAQGNGIADDKGPIDAALDSIRQVGGVVYFPPGVYNTSAGHDTRINGLSIVGAGTGATTIRINHPTRDLFSLADFASNQTYRDFSVRSDLGVRTAGWVLRVQANPGGFSGGLVESRILDLDINGQANGIWLAQFASVFIDRVQIKNFSVDGGIGLKAGQRSTSGAQGVNLNVQGMEIYGIGRPIEAGFRFLPEYAYVIEDARAVAMADVGAGGSRTTGLLIVSHGGAVSDLRFKQSVFDATLLGPTAHITGSGVVTNIAFTNCWFASAGQLEPLREQPRPATVVLDPGSIDRTAFVGGRFVNSKGEGILLRPRTGNSDVVLNGVVIRSNQRSGIDALAPLNALGPVISGVDQARPHGGAGLATTPTTNRVVAVGNRFVNGTAFGIAPQVAANNGQ